MDPTVDAGPHAPEGLALTHYDPAVDVSAIVINWNGLAHLETCLSSLLQQTRTRIEVLLVDNGSNDGSLDFLRTRFGSAVGVLAQPANRGYGSAANVGIRAARVRLTVVVAATLGTAAAVAVSGLIGFVGIIVPHTVRLIFGSSYRRVLPLSIILGAAFLIVADLIARTALSPAEIPIGVITAFFGAPFFLLVLRRTRSLS